MSTIAWLGALALACGAAAQGAGNACRACKGQGEIPCSRHGRLLGAEHDGAVVHCSAAAECKACEGALAVDCRSCANPTAEAELARRRAAARDWLRGRRVAVDALTGREPYLHLATPNFDLASTLKPATVGREKLDQHARLHLHGERLEQLRALFLTTLELTAGDLPDRVLVVASEEAADHATVGPRLTGMGTANSVGLKLAGPEFVYSMWADKRSLPTDEAVHRNIVHHVTHLLLSQMRPMRFLGNQGHGWIDEGLAHWFEDQVVGKCANFCFEEVLLLSPMSFRGGNWRPAVRRMADEGKLIPLAALAAKNTDELDPAEHALAFAFVDFLLTAHGGAKFRDFVRLLKDGAATREALPQIYGFNLLSVDTSFAAWVKASYAPQTGH